MQIPVRAQATSVVDISKIYRHQDKEIFMNDPLMSIDWNQVWINQMRKNRESSQGRDCARIWETREKALEFWDMCHKERSRIDQTVWEMPLTSQSRVLDIGAGPGTLAIPFAKKAAHVTAVEPAEGMATVLKEKMAEFGLGNIKVVQKLWEDVDVAEDLQAPYDVVVASFSLGMPDIRAAIEKMVAATSKYVYLYHFAGPGSWDRLWQELWPRLHGRAYIPGPKCDVLYNVLYQMGIYPNIRTFRLEHSQSYSSLDDAVEKLAGQAGAETDRQKAILRECLARAMREEKGTLVLPGSSMRVKMWWEKQPLSAH